MFDRYDYPEKARKIFWAYSGCFAREGYSLQQQEAIIASFTRADDLDVALDSMTCPPIIRTYHFVGNQNTTREDTDAFGLNSEVLERALLENWS